MRTVNLETDNFWVKEGLRQWATTTLLNIEIYDNMKEPVKISECAFADDFCKT